MTAFKKISISDWRQFGEVEIEFGDRMTILTGANGAGKTTILNLLARHFGWSISFISTRSITKRGVWKYFTGAGRFEFDNEEKVDSAIGQIVYGSGETAELRVPPSAEENYNVKITNQQSVEGIYVTSHRPVYAYQRVDQIPTQMSATSQLFDEYVNNLRQYYNANARIQSPSYRLKTALISLATFGYGNQAVDPNDEARSTFESFQDVLRQVLPADLEFLELRIRLPDVIIRCARNEFSIDAASGGVQALIDLAWQIHMRSLISESFVVILDEPENHLHPRLQRSVLPGLITAFPQAQFIAATHNPFVVTSVPDSNVSVLDFVEGKVVSKDLSAFDKAGSANQVLMDVLGVPFPMPLWVETELDNIVTSLSDIEIDEASLRTTRQRLAELGLGDMFPEVVDRLLRRRDTAL